MAARAAAAINLVSKLLAPLCRRRARRTEGVESGRARAPAQQDRKEAWQAARATVGTS